MARINFTLDTTPMANEIRKVSTHVNGVSTAVVGMQTAVIAAEQEAAKQICRDVNKGFYALMQSQISQKVATLNSKIESKLIELGQQAVALTSIKNKMERDYNMIANRYGKLFCSLNSSLQSRVYEIDKPIVSLVNKDMQLSSSRVKDTVGFISINQSESIYSAQLIAASKTKSNGLKAIDAICGYLDEDKKNARMLADAMGSVNIERTETIYLPIMTTEVSAPFSPVTVNFFAPTSNISSIDDALALKVRDQAFNVVHNGTWEKIDEDTRVAIDREFSAIFHNDALDEKVRETISKLYDSNCLKQLKAD